MNPIESLRAAMPQAVREQWDEQDRREAKLAEDIRKECAEALTCLADAIKQPRIARLDLEDAIKHVSKALSIAAILDPE